MWVEERKPQFEAKQFTGGLDSAVELIRWLEDSRGIICVSWLPPFQKEGYIKGFSKELLRIQMSDGSINIEVGEWLIKDPSKPPAQQLLFCSPETFDHKYALVEEVLNGREDDS